MEIKKATEYKCYICQKTIKKSEAYVFEFKDMSKYVVCEKCKIAFMKMIGKAIKG